MSIGEWIRDNRKAEGMSQDELSWKAHVGLRRISAYERGENEPSIKHLTAIAEALGKPLPWSDRSTARYLGGAAWGMDREPIAVGAATG